MFYHIGRQLRVGITGKTIKLSYAAISSSHGMGLFASYLGNIAGASLVAWRSQAALYACGEIQPNKK
ncbi:hypothetical protein NEIELOOT_01301 [Neisseria elongata subsp. glycolytica ATCC 29315]|uniref:Uncharacterized protein n=1 Tax=Neisseria elongata subsp. glycolytica ATCC 29315 TaxID=546263 RepID=D4DQG5_NEIEG|nr:hypothetical protein NEIELOOT_01301 [Neisseria elongata subsp. glycolytica ATCC 29315]